MSSIIVPEELLDDLSREEFDKLEQQKYNEPFKGLIERRNILIDEIKEKKIDEDLAEEKYTDIISDIKQALEAKTQEGGTFRRSKRSRSKPRRKRSRSKQRRSKRKSSKLSRKRSRSKRTRTRKSKRNKKR